MCTRKISVTHHYFYRNTGAQQIDPLTSEWLRNSVAKGIALALNRSWVRIPLKTPENFFRCIHEIVTETVQLVWGSFLQFKLHVDHDIKASNNPSANADCSSSQHYTVIYESISQWRDVHKRNADVYTHMERSIYHIHPCIIRTPILDCTFQKKKKKKDAENRGRNRRRKNSVKTSWLGNTQKNNDFIISSEN